MTCKTLIFCIVGAFTLTSCGNSSYNGSSSMSLNSPIKNKDKHLSCQDLVLEMNETEYHARIAKDKKRFSFSSVFSPIAYINRYGNANDDLSNSQYRIEYLTRIYQIMDCDSITS